VVRFCDRADIAVDQLMIGAYGTVSIEMMAKGVPVVCRIRDDLRRYYPDDLPIVSAEPGIGSRSDSGQDIYSVLEDLILRPEQWHDLGKRGLDYVTREHEMHSVAARVLPLYELDHTRSASE
jgi:hypothetical protein